MKIVIIYILAYYKMHYITNKSTRKGAGLCTDLIRVSGPGLA